MSAATESTFSLVTTAATGSPSHASGARLGLDVGGAPALLINDGVRRPACVRKLDGNRRSFLLFGLSFAF